MLHLKTIFSNFTRDQNTFFRKNILKLRQKHYNKEENNTGHQKTAKKNKFGHLQPIPFKSKKKVTENSWKAQMTQSNAWNSLQPIWERKFAQLTRPVWGWEVDCSSQTIQKRTRGYRGNRTARSSREEKREREGQVSTIAPESVKSLKNQLFYCY